MQGAENWLLAHGTQATTLRLGGCSGLSCGLSCRGEAGGGLSRHAGSGLSHRTSGGRGGSAQAATLHRGGDGAGGGLSHHAGSWLSHYAGSWLSHYAGSWLSHYAGGGLGGSALGGRRWPKKCALAKVSIHEFLCTYKVRGRILAALMNSTSLACAIL